MGRGIFGGMFDLNHDGKMNAFERAAEMQFLHDVVMAEDETDDTDFEFDEDADFEEDF